MRQYSADQVAITWFGVDLGEGLARGTFLQVSRNAETWTQKPNGMGGVVRMYNPDLSGSAALTLDAESYTHQALVTVATADRITRAAVGPMVVTDLSTREVIVLSNAYIATVPNIQKGTQPTALTWRFNFEAVISQSFGFNNNRVGA